MSMMFPEIYSTLCLCNPEVLHGGIRAFLTIFYKAAECISLAQHVSANSATDSGKNEQEVPPLAGEKMDPSCGKAVGTGGCGMLH